MSGYFLVGITALFILFATLWAFAFDDLRKLKGEAVKLGYAEWKPSEKTGCPIFSWKEKLP